MDQRLESLFEKYGLPGAVLAEANLNKRDKKLAVVISAGSVARAGNLSALERDLADFMPGCDVEVTVRCEGIAELIANNDKAALDALRDSWCDIQPVVRPAMANSVWQAEGCDITVKVPASLMALADNPSLARSAEAYYERVLGVRVSIKLAADEEIKPVITDKPPEPVRIAPRAEHKPAPRKKETDKAEIILGKAIRKAAIIKQSAVDESMGFVTIQGEVISSEMTKRKNGGSILTVVISDHTNTLPCKVFLEDNQEAEVDKALSDVKKKGDYLVVAGRYSMDAWLRRMCVYPRDMGRLPREVRKDTAEEKRVELHLHTKMSGMDGLTSVKDAIKTAASWGHRAIAITDHGVVHAFPDAVAQADKLAKDGKDIKVLMGVEGYLLPDSELIERQNEYVSVAITSAPGIKLDEVFEIAAVRFDASGERDSAVFIIDSGATLTESIAQATGLTQQALSQGIPMGEAVKRLGEFVGDSIKVVQDTECLDLLRQHGERFELGVDTHCVSTGMLYHYLHRESKVTDITAALNTYGMDMPTGSALDRAKAQAAVMNRLLEEMEHKGIEKLPLTEAVPAEKAKGKRQTYHIIIIAKNHEGLKNLYRLVSYAHLEHLRKVPRIPRSLLLMHREGLIVGSACEAGELFRSMLKGADDDTLKGVADMYDFLEIQPIANNAFLMRNGTVKDEEGLKDFNRRIVELGEELNKPVVATGDVHFLEPDHAQFRSIIMHARGFEDAEEQAPLYFRTTDDMLDEFAYLGEEKAKEVVITNPNMIADSCDRMKAFLSEKGTYAPTFPGANDELRDMSMKRAHELYGDELPEIVQKRLDKELNSIIGNGYASLYLMAQRLVQKSMSDGYLVGSRGSVGSSFVANMAGITEVNALQPHYVCPNCRHSDFDVDRTVYACGVDMPDADCPVCGTKYNKLGYEIPFEVFLGFKGDKTPDIDLNFSGEYQPVAHKFTEVMFGEGHAFRAGTISGIKDKTVYGYVKAYCEDNGMMVSRDEMDRLVQGCAGVKKTTGQHPGGIVIVPQENDIMEFTPIQYPADRSEGDTITTHFDFHAMDDRLVKLDILGHDDPTVLRMLKDITGLDPQSIPLDDPETMRIFSSSEPLGVSLEELDCDVGSIAIPEFGTTFVRQMLKDTRPTTMEELVRISGLSHGTDVWLGNAQELVLSGTATLSQVICTRDDIMNYLILRGGDPSMSFKTMESVRKGRGVTPEMEEHMHSIDTPEWFIDSCKKIKYMFPRAHAAAYVMMAFRVAYYKVHLPIAFYAVYYSVRADAFDIAQASGGAERVLANINAIKKKGNDMDNKEADLLTILEVVYEMNKRGIELLPVDLYKSRASEFVIEGDKIRPPFSAIAGVGENAAIGIAEGAKDGEYTSIENFQARTGANSAVIKALSELGCLEGLPQTDQLSLF